MDEPLRPQPIETELSAPYWQAARELRLVIQKCATCEKYQFPPQVTCQRCGSREIGWEQASGRATLYSWTVCYPPSLPWFVDRVPWPVAAVELEEGVRMITNVVGIPVDCYEIGMPLEADYEPVDEGLTLVVFRPAAT